MGFLRSAPSIDELEEENERRSIEVKVAEKKAMIAELKKRHGSDWKMHLPKIESGIDWSSLKFRLR